MASAGPFLPAILKPPHDPTSLLLNQRVGWRAVQFDRVEIQTDGSLILAVTPDSKRSLIETSGSFGGLALPTNIALGTEGSLFLLDPLEFILKRFDPCTCDFEEVPCFGGSGSGVRQFADPHGIGICCGNLFVCDTGHHRLSVFSLYGFALRGHWVPPATAGLTNPWEPYDVAFDSHGRVYVSDIANGSIHRFTGSGRWETCFPGFGMATHLAMDTKDHLYVVVSGSPDEIRVLGESGTPETVQGTSKSLASRFSPLPFEVDSEGRLHLATICAAPANSDSPKPRSCIFDLYGDPVSDIVSIPCQYQTDGAYISQALDSNLYRCQWHRIILHATIPMSCRVRVSTFTAEAELMTGELLNLSHEQWKTRQLATSLDDNQWDCLIGSDKGRYLWLKLDLRGTGRATPAISSLEIEFPRISLRRYLPAAFGNEPVSADFTDRFLSTFDTTLRGIEAQVDTLGQYFDPLSAPATPLEKGGTDFLNWLASWIGVALDRRWPESKRRQFLKRAGKLFNLRGTREGLWRQLIFFLDMEHVGQKCCSDVQPKAVCNPAKANCTTVKSPICSWGLPPLILEHYRIRRWLFLAAGRLSDQAVLWGKSIVNRSQLDENARVDRTQLIMTQDPYRDPFHVYAHKYTVFIPARFGSTDQMKKSLETLLKNESPAHTQYVVNYVEPRFRVGIQATIGFDAVVAGVRQGITLNEAKLGRGTILGHPSGRKDGPSFELGKDPRVGTTTSLD